MATVSLKVKKLLLQKVMLSKLCSITHTLLPAGGAMARKSCRSAPIANALIVVVSANLKTGKLDITRHGAEKLVKSALTTNSEKLWARD